MRFGEILRMLGQRRTVSLSWRYQGSARFQDRSRSKQALEISRDLKLEVGRMQPVQSYRIVAMSIDWKLPAAERSS